MGRFFGIIDSEPKLEEQNWTKPNKPQMQLARVLEGFHWLMVCDVSWFWIHGPNKGQIPRNIPQLLHYILNVLVALTLEEFFFGF